MKRQKAFLLGGVSALCIVFTGLAAAADITYTVDDTVGTGTVMGTITTNGTLGTITSFFPQGVSAPQFFQSYNLTLTLGGQSEDITGGAAVANSGPFGQIALGSLSATSTGLFWNFGSSRDALSFQTGPGSGVFPCWELRGTAPGLCQGGTPPNSTSGMSNLMVLALSSSNFSTQPGLTGSFEFAKVGPPPPPPSVPEPGSLGLLAAGLVGLLGLRKRLV